MEKHHNVNPKTNSEEHDEEEVLTSTMGSTEEISDYVELTYVDEVSDQISTGSKRLCEASGNMDTLNTVDTFCGEDTYCQSEDMDKEDCYRLTDAATGENPADAEKRKRQMTKISKSAHDENRRTCEMCGEVTNGKNTYKKIHGDPISGRDDDTDEENYMDNDTEQEIIKLLECSQIGASPTQGPTNQVSESSFQNFENERLEFSRSNSKVENGDNVTVINMYEHSWPSHFENEAAEVQFNNMNENPDLTETEVYMDTTEKISVRPKKSDVSPSESMTSMTSSFTKNGEPNTRHWCLWTILIATMTSVMVSVGVCALVAVYLREHDTEWEPEVPKVAMSSEDQGNVSGLKYALSMTDSRMHLYLDQHELKDHGKLLWTDQGLEDAFITPDIRLSTSGENGKFGCAGISKRGFYQIVSHVTFRFYRRTRARHIYHSVYLEKNGRNGQILKNSFTLPAAQNELPREILPSVLFGFHFLDPGDRICVTVSDTRLVYVSVTDNYFTLVKM